MVQQRQRQGSFVKADLPVFDKAKMGQVVGHATKMGTGSAEVDPNGADQCLIVGHLRPALRCEPGTAAHPVPRMLQCHRDVTVQP